MHHKDDAEGLDLLMPMYNRIEYSSNYSETAGSLWFYSKEKIINFNVDNANTDNLKLFKYEAKLLRNADSQPGANASNGILRKKRSF